MRETWTTRKHLTPDERNHYDLDMVKKTEKPITDEQRAAIDRPKDSKGLFISPNPDTPKDGRTWKGTDIKCPQSLIDGGMEGVWQALARRAVSGDKSAQSELIRWYKHESGSGGAVGMAEAALALAGGVCPPALPVARPAQPGGLPPGSVALLAELDLEIAYVVRRYEMGLPCHDVEILLAETQLATDAGDTHGRTRRGTIAQTLTDMLTDARAQVLRDQPPQPMPPADETPEARRLRLLDSQCATYRKRHEVATASWAERHPPKSPPDAPGASDPPHSPPESAQATDGDDTAPEGIWARRAREKEVDQEKDGEEQGRE